ncbi:MAG: bacteriocin [Parasphingorhabdus sp.]
MTDRIENKELNENELDQITGGVALLLPAVQAARGPSSFKTTSTSAKGRAVPTEDFSLNYEKIKVSY